MAVTHSESRQDIEFRSRGIVCRGWLTVPRQVSRCAPLVILGHGFGGTRAMRLEAYAQRFNEVGLATLIFDYRRFGASDGEPRQLLVPRDEVEDWHAALAFARTIESIDSERIALWGTSLAGGLVVSAAAEDGQVAATVSQCPLFDGRAAAVELARYAGLSKLLRIGAHGLWDVLRAAVGGAPHYIPIVAEPGGVAAMTSADARPGYARIATADFRNQVTARSALMISQFRPLRDAGRVKCPALVQICERDSVAPVVATERAIARMAHAEVQRYEVGHFDVYNGPAFERSVNDQLVFLRKHLIERSPSAANHCTGSAQTRLRG